MCSSQNAEVGHLWGRVLRRGSVGGRWCAKQHCEQRKNGQKRVNESR